VQPGLTRCELCDQEQPAWAVTRCPMCGKNACSRCGRRLHGRQFCSLRCADFFFRGDGEDEDSETET
jgi:hypothetical protein